MKVEGADSISVTANASGLEGCVAPAHIKGYNFKLFSAIGTSIGSVYNYQNQEYLFEGLQENTRYKATTRVKDAAGNIGNFSSFTFMYTLAANPESVSITGRTNESLSYSMDRSNQSDGTENKVCLSDATGSVSEMVFGMTTTGTFINLEEGKEYQIGAVARNSDDVESLAHMYWIGTTRKMPRGAIISPNGDVHIKADGTFILGGTYQDADGDEVSISAFIGDVEGLITKDAATWSASWDASQLPEGPQVDICIALSDDGGSGETKLTWQHDLTVDRISPTQPGISTNPSSLTSGSVLVSLSGEENANIHYSLNGASDVIYENPFAVDENVSLTAFQSDLAGNLSGESNLKIDWIDTTSPTGNISYSETDLTNESVIATLATYDENAVTITNNGGLNTYDFTTNGSFTFEFEDAAGNNGSAVAEVSWIDKEAQAPPTITMDPENGISRNSVEIILSQERDSDVESIEYRLIKSTESAWITYDKPFGISEKGIWILEARAWDKAGNKSVLSQRELILKNARKREIEPSPEAVSRMGINLAYVLPSGTILDIKKIVTPYDEFGNIIENKSFTFESSDSSILEILSDGSIISKNPGSVYLTATDIGTVETCTIPLLVEASMETGNDAMTDIENHWAEDAIDEFCHKGFIRGYEDGTFRPENEITIEECIAILERVRLCGFDLDYAPRKSDLPEMSAGDWSLCYALSSLSRMDVDILMDAFGDDLLLSRPITRGEVAMLLYQSENWTQLDEDADMPFSDVEGHCYRTYMACAYKRGLLKGYPDGTFRPDNRITRAEMTILFCRFIDSL